MVMPSVTTTGMQRSRSYGCRRQS